MSKHSIRCESCGDLLNASRVVYLELDQRTNTYTNQEVPPEYSQGSFPFGASCADKAVAAHETIANHKRQDGGNP